MSRLIVGLALVPVLGCSGAVRDQTEQNSADLSALQADLAAVEERLAEVESSVAKHNTDIDQIREQADANELAIDAVAGDVGSLQVRVDDHDGAIADASAALAGLDARLFDPYVGEIPLLQAQLAADEALIQANRDDIDQHRIDIDTNTAAIAAVGLSVADLDARVAAGEIAILVNAADIQQNASDIAAMAADVDAISVRADALDASMDALRTDVAALDAAVDANTAAVAAQDARIDANAAAIATNAATLAVHASEIATAQADIAANAAAIAQNTADLSANAAAIAFNAGAIAQNTIDIAAILADYVTSADLGTYLTAADLTPLEIRIDANASDVAQIETNYLPALDDLLLYLSADTATDTVTVSGGDLNVDGRVLGKRMTVRQCADGFYRCNPMECLAVCATNGERLAYTEEVLAYAAGKNDKCQFLWMMDRNNPQVPVRSYPMYFNRTTPGCGPTNTGDVPRLGIEPIVAADWFVTDEYNCACATQW